MHGVGGGWIKPNLAKRFGPRLKAKDHEAGYTLSILGGVFQVLRRIRNSSKFVQKRRFWKPNDQYSKDHEAGYTLSILGGVFQVLRRIRNSSKFVKKRRFWKPNDQYSKDHEAGYTLSILGGDQLSCH